MATAQTMSASDVPMGSEFTSAPSLGTTKTEEESPVAKLKQFAYDTFASAKGFVNSAKSWLAFFDVRRARVPKKFDEATKSLGANWKHFRVNYLVVMAITMTTTMLLRSFYSFALLVVLSLIWAWVVWLRPNAKGNLKLFGRDYSPMEQRILLGFGSFVMVFFFSNAASSAFTAATIGSLVCAAHGALMREPEGVPFDDLEQGGTSAAGGGGLGANPIGDVIGAGIQLQNMFTTTK